MSNKKILDRELLELKKINYSKRIKLRFKSLSDGRLSLYLDYWNGAKREYQFLKIYLSNRITTYESDKSNFLLAVSIRDKKEIVLMQQNNDFELRNWKQEANYIDFFQSICMKQPATEKAWGNTLKHLKSFENYIKIKNITPKFIEDFRSYILSKVSANTAHTYLSKIKASLNIAIKEKIIIYNPATGVKIKRTQAQREFLLLEEIRILKRIVFHHGGVIMTVNDIPSSFQILSLLEAFTMKVYVPALVFLYSA